MALNRISPHDCAIRHLLKDVVCTLHGCGGPGYYHSSQVFCPCSRARLTWTISPFIGISEILHKVATSVLFKLKFFRLGFQRGIALLECFLSQEECCSSSTELGFIALVSPGSSRYKSAYLGRLR